MSLNQDLKAFKKRIIASQESEKTDKLLKLISKEDLNILYNFFIDNDKAELKNLNTLKPGEAFRFAKEETNLPRTMVIIRSDNGEYKLIVEIKSKLAEKEDNSQLYKKNKKNQPSGSSKYVTNAYRIDGPEIEMVNLRIKNIDDYDDILKEIEKTKLFANHENIAKVEIGVIFTGRKGQKKLSLYAERALCDLEEFLSKRSYRNIPEIQKEKMILDLLEAVKFIHDKGYVHQDIKIVNILVFQNEDGTYYLKLTDFGLMVKINENKAAKATVGYESPEISSVNEFFDLPDNNYLQNTAYPSIGRDLYLSNEYKFDQKIALQIDQDALQENPDQTTFLNDQAWYYANKANDIFSLGIVAFEILNNGHYPSLQDVKGGPLDPLLKKLLSANRETRWNIDQALDYQKQKVNTLIASTPKRIKLSK